MIPEQWFPIFVLAARVLMAAVFLVSGIEKSLNFSRALGEFAKDNIPFPQISVVFTIVLHLIASVCLIAGWLVSEMALSLALFTLIATLLVHKFWTMTGVERLQRSRVALANLGLVGGLLLLAVTGPGTLVF
jgi:putative oxidoreductase